MERSANGMVGSSPGATVDGAERAAGGPFAPDDPKPGETWRHYNGHDYEVVAVGLDEATRTPMVAYRCPESGKTRFRTLADFTEYVHAEGGTGRVYSRRRFVRVYRPKDDDGPDSVPGPGVAEVLYAQERANGRADIDRGRTAATERGEGEACRQLDEIRAICRAEGIDFGTTADSVRMLATRARLYIEMTDRANRGRDVSQDGNPDEADLDLLLKLRDVWASLQCVISRLDTAMLYSGASFGGTPIAVIEAIRENACQASQYLDESLTDVEYANGIEPGEPD